MRWLCARIHFVRGSGFIWIVLMRRICHRSGIVVSVRNRRIRREMRRRGGFLLISRVGRSDFCVDDG